MNYLAHAYLSFQQDDILVGNLISDFVKGRKRYDYPLSIQHGIELHRRIDAFTDTHGMTAAVKEYFKPAVGAYSGAFADVAFDYFLANDDNEFSKNDLADFAGYVYSVLDDRFEFLPSKFQQMLPYMKQQNWLYNYREHWGIEKSLEGIVKRANYLHDSKPAFSVFIEYCDTLRPFYQKFFPQLKTFAFEQMQTLVSQSQ